MKKILPILFIFLMIMHSPSWGAEPLDILKGQVDQVMSILQDPQYSDQSKKGAQRERIWAIIRGFFDMEEMSKRAVAQHWKRFTPQEQKEFIKVFGDFLGDNYLQKIQGGFKGEKVIYGSQEQIGESKATVNTKILRANVETPVNYSMAKDGDSWKVYDVTIEGVSLVRNYRSQFSQILVNESPAQLIERVKKKIE